MTALTDLRASFIVRTDNGFRRVDGIGEAEGVMFLCPKCYDCNGGAKGTHMVVCWTPKVPDDTQPKPGRWTLVGTGIHDLTLDGANGKSRSVLLLGGCDWHGFVTNGDAS